MQAIALCSALRRLNNLQKSAVSPHGMSRCLRLYYCLHVYHCITTYHCITATILLAPEEKRYLYPDSLMYHTYTCRHRLMCGVIIWCKTRCSHPPSSRERDTQAERERERERERELTNNMGRLHRSRVLYVGRCCHSRLALLGP